MRLRPAVFRLALGLLTGLALPARAWAQSGPAAPAGDDDGVDPGPPPGNGEGGEGEGEGEGGGGGEAALPVAQEPPVSDLTPEQRRLLVPSLGETPNREDSGSHRFFFPPYLHEWGRGHHTRVVFPVYFESHHYNDHTLVIPPFYRERSPTLDVDAFAPFYFSFRGRRVDPNAPPPVDPGQTPVTNATWAADVVGPVWYYRSVGPSRARAMNLGVAPIFSYGATFNEQGTLQREHLVIPWLLTYHQWLPDSQVTVVGPFVYHRDHTTTDWAVVPFVIRHVTPQREWTVIPPLLTYHRVDHEDNSQFTLVGPLFWETGPDFASYNFAPVFFHWHNRTSSRTTLLPFFHTESGTNRFTLITPLGGYSREGSESTVILPFYQNHRGVSNLDAIAPFFFYSRTPRLKSWTFALPPIMFASGSPTGYAWGVFPFIGRWHEYGRYDTTATLFFVHSREIATRSSTTWIFPSIHIRNEPNYHLRNVYPFFWSETHAHHHYAVLFPFYWDIGDETTGRRVTVMAPFYMRVASPTTLAEYYFPNFVRWRQDRDGVRYDGWDFAPFVQYQSSRNHDVAWSVLEGLVGYRRSGSFEQIRVFYYPVQLNSGATQPAPAPQSRQDHDTVIRM